MSVSETLLRPQWAGGWALARLLFGAAALYTHLKRVVHVTDALAAPTIVFSTGPAQVADRVLLPAPAAWALWALGLVGIFGIFRGRGWAKPGVLLWFGVTVALVASLGLNVRVPERFLVWAVVGLLLGPLDLPSPTRAEVRPVARLYLLVVYGSLYLSTGLMKLLEEPAWRDGSALALDLVDRFHAGGPLAVLVSGSPALCTFASWFTLTFEVGFVFFIGFRRTSAWTLVAGAMMHLGIAALMEVGPLGYLAISLYPVLLAPDAAQAGWQEAVRRWPALGRLAGELPA
jgi:hypothetical protein